VALWALGFVGASVRARTGGCGSGSSLTFHSTQEVSIANLRAFAHGLKNDEKRKYEGVSAAEESSIRGAQLRTVASVKSKEKAYKDIMNEMANTKIYKSLGSLQKNPSFDPSI
jgi:hypothetical protein